MPCLICITYSVKIRPLSPGTTFRTSTKTEFSDPEILKDMQFYMHPIYSSSKKFNIQFFSKEMRNLHAESEKFSFSAETFLISSHTKLPVIGKAHDPNEVFYQSVALSDSSQALIQDHEYDLSTTQIQWHQLIFSLVLN